MSDPIYPVEFYRIINALSNLILVPKEPENPTSVLIQDSEANHSANPSVYHWGFIQEQSGIYRVFNRLTGLCVSTFQEPHPEEALLQSAWTNQDNQKWSWNNSDNRFHSASNSNLVWGVLKSLDPGAPVQILNLDGGAYQQWILRRVAMTELEAAQSAAS